MIAFMVYVPYDQNWLLKNWIAIINWICRYKQSNSYSNEENQNIALNIWFNHLHDHKPTCDLVHDSEATLDQYQFSDQQEEYESDNESVVQNDGSEMMEYTRERQDGPNLM